MNNDAPISLPVIFLRAVKTISKNGNRTSLREFFRGIKRAWDEEKVLSILREGEKEFREGKTKVLHSLADLD